MLYRHDFIQIYSMNPYLPMKIAAFTQIFILYKSKFSNDKI